MAGDWIKVEHATAKKPEVLKMARMLGISRREMVGTLIDFLVWCDANSVDGVVDGVVDADVDELMSCAGFSAVMREVGWLCFSAEPPSMRMVNWERHNGETAKKRALKNERQARWRAKNVDARPSTNASTREEKRREEVNTYMSDSQETANADVVSLPQKERPSRLKQDASDVLSFLNERTGHHYRPTDQTLKPIMARLKEGYSVAECRAVIARKRRDWGGDDKMRPYLRPATLFGAEKFSQYVGEVPPEVSNG